MTAMEGVAAWVRELREKIEERGRLEKADPWNVPQEEWGTEEWLRWMRINLLCIEQRAKQELDQS